jgi:hypothetical protein
MKHGCSKNVTQSELVERKGSAYLSKRSDASAIENDETKNKTVDQISGLYGCGESDTEKFSFGCDLD